MQLQGKNALITGGDSGIGQAIAITFAREGANVVIHFGNDRQGAEQTAAQARQHGVRAVVLQADLADPRNAASLFQQAEQELGTIDILVNNAGTGPAHGGALEETVDDFVRVLNIDLVSPFVLSQEAGRRMVERGAGTIVNITSVAQQLVDAGSTSYHVAKGGLKNLTENFALELAPKGVRVNSIAPGTIQTPMTASQLSDTQKVQERSRQIPLQRVGRPQDIADAALYLVSEQASYVTGTSLIVDGGLLLHPAS